MKDYLVNLKNSQCNAEVIAVKPCRIVKRNVS